MVSPAKQTDVTRVPRESQWPGRPLSATPSHVQVRPSVLVAYSVAIWSASAGSSRGWQVTHMCHSSSRRMITGSLTPFFESPGSTTWLRRESNSAGWEASTTSTRQCFVPGVAQLRYSRQVPSGVRTRYGRSSESVASSSLWIMVTGSKCSPSAERATATAYPRPWPSGRRSR